MFLEGREFTSIYISHTSQHNTSSLAESSEYLETEPKFPMLDSFAT